MLRPSRLKHVSVYSEYVLDNDYLKRKISIFIVWAGLFAVFPAVSVKAYNLLDRLPYWQ